MKFFTLISILSVIVFSGCITTHYGIPQTAADNKLKVSCSQPDWLTDQFAAFSCSFENNTESWVDVETAQITLEGDKNINPLTPEQTLAFAKAYQFKQTKDRANEGIILGSLAVAGVIAASGSGNRSVAGTGAGVALGAMSYSAGHQIADSVHAAQYPSYGDSHILGPKDSVPAKLFIRKSAVFQLTDADLSHSVLKICLKLPKEECITSDLNRRQRRYDNGYSQR